MRALAARLRRLERCLGAGETARMIVVEAPNGEGLAERARAVLAASGITPSPVDMLVILRRFHDPDGPARLVAVHPLRRP
jgi:hypothetical protein